jgi:hypothetical protein
VHVAVPRAVTADHHDRVADLPQPFLKSSMRSSGRSQKYITCSATRHVAAMRHLLERRRVEADVVHQFGHRQRARGHHVQRRVEEQEEAGPAGVDHTGLL